jgi:hypothetical protein
MAQTTIQIRTVHEAPTAVGWAGQRTLTKIEARMPPRFPRRGHGNRGMKGLPRSGLLWRM